MTFKVLGLAVGKLQVQLLAIPLSCKDCHQTVEGDTFYHGPGIK